MKKFEIWDYPKECPAAHATEDAINNCSRPESNLEKVKDVFGGNEDRMQLFFIACMLYWSETEYYDERNRSAILLTREIVSKYTALKKMNITDELLKEAAGFTLRAHRYLQSMLFSIILVHLKITGFMGIHDWYQEQEFVIDRNQEKALPYKTWKKQRK